MLVRVWVAEVDGTLWTDRYWQVTGGACHQAKEYGYGIRMAMVTWESQTTSWGQQQLRSGRGVEALRWCESTIQVRGRDVKDVESERRLNPQASSTSYREFKIEISPRSSLVVPMIVNQQPIRRYFFPFHTGCRQVTGWSRQALRIS